MDTILGLELGEFKSVACACDPSTQVGRHATIATDLATLRWSLNRNRPDRLALMTRVRSQRHPRRRNQWDSPEDQRPSGRSLVCPSRGRWLPKRTSPRRSHRSHSDE